MEFLKKIQASFWNPDVWLPPSIEWKDLIPNEKVHYASFSDLIYPIPLALLIILVRIFFERKVYNPLGVNLGIRNCKRRSIKHYDELERAYRKRNKVSHKEIESLAKKIDLDTRQVERWMRNRLILDKPTTLSKFSESGWRFTFYTSSFIAGLYVLWDKPWFWDINYCWYNYPHHSVPNDIWWYYMYGSSFYWSLMFSQFFDTKRKDFWQMFLHHMTTICLLGFSWTCNLTRVGTLVLLLHDCADSFLEIAKMVKYAEYDRLCDILFALFALIWIITRLGIYPIHILSSTVFEAPKMVPMFPAYYIFNGMLLILLFLHIFWTYYIFKVAYKAFSVGKVGSDERSSESGSGTLSLSEDDNKVSNKKSHKTHIN